MNEFAVVALASIFSSNVMAVAGVGVASIQSQKKNFLFMLVTSMCAVVSIIVAGLACFGVNMLLSRFDVEYLKMFVVVLLAIVTSFVSRLILKAATKEIYYVYETSYSFPIQTIVTAGTLLIVDFSRTFLMTMFELSMFCVGYLLVQVLFYALYERLDNSYVLKPARNIPVMLYTLSVIGMILYVVEMMF